MPSSSAAQHKLMVIAEHTKGGFGGVPQKVGKDFAHADQAEGKFQGKGKAWPANRTAWKAGTA